jgi:hypothetical protein
MHKPEHAAQFCRGEKRWKIQLIGYLASNNNVEAALLGLMAMTSVPTSCAMMCLPSMWLKHKIHPSSLQNPF